MEKMKISKQFAKSLMLALQICIAEEKNIFDILESFDVVNSGDGLVVLNPPVYSIKKSEETEEEEIEEKE